MDKAIVKRVLSVGFLAGGLLMSASLQAHHGYSLNYETEETGTIEGVVQEVFWANPHVHYYLTVTHEDGSTQTWDVETHNLRILQRHGWSRETIQAGDHVAVTGYLGKDGKPRIAGRKFVLEDGTVYSLFGEGNGSSE